jgi:hypothetical protein
MHRCGSATFRARFPALMPLCSSRSPLIDEVWHAHILCTKDYRTFCADVFGEYLDHLPGSEGFNWAYYDNTTIAYEKKFGAPVDIDVLVHIDVRSATLDDIWPSRSSLEDILADSEGSPGECGSCG